MQTPLQITFRHIEQSDALEARIREHADKLRRYHDNIIACRVVFDAPHRHHHKGNLYHVSVYHVSVDVRVPGHEIAVSREADERQDHQDAYVAVRDAFEAVYKQLRAVARIDRQEVKTHEPPATGTITSLPWQQDFGTIRTPLGRELYFHRNSVLNDAFDTLEIGQAVRFHEEQGNDGPQASTVTVLK